MPRNQNPTTGRSIIVDDNGNQFELIPRVTASELREMSEHIPGVLLENIVSLDKKDGDNREYKVYVGQGAHSKTRLARRLLGNNELGEYVIVRKAHSADYLEKQHSKKLSTQSPGLFSGKAKRKETIEASKKEHEIIASLADLDQVCVSHSFVHSHKKGDIETEQLYQFMPFATLGDLKKLRDIISNTYLSEDERTALLTHISNQLISAVLNLHTKSNIRHRDIKPGNILLTIDGNVMLTDFGSAAYSTDGSNWLTLSPLITPNYHPPVSYYHQAPSNTETRYRIHDEWALAITLLEVWNVGSEIIHALKCIQITCREMNPSQADERHDSVLKNINAIREGLQTHPNYQKIPAHIRNYIECALELDPKKRHSHIQDMVDTKSIAARPDIGDIMKNIKTQNMRRNELFLRQQSPRSVVADEGSDTQSMQAGAYYSLSGYPSDDTADSDPPKPGGVGGK